MIFSNGFCIYAMDAYKEIFKFKKIIILYMFKMNMELNHGSYEWNDCTQAIILKYISGTVHETVFKHLKQNT